MFTIHHWLRQHGAALGCAKFKVKAEDFVVTEELGFEPSGAGEHIFLWIEKTNLNTAFVAEQLAKFSQLPLRDVTYAGRKDKYARTRQWFGLHLANRREPDWSTLDIQGVTVLSKTRNDRKLRTGVLKSNHFDITLRDLSNPSTTDIEQRLTAIALNGVPNYYGEQRFGKIRFATEHSDTSAAAGEALPGNLALAEKMMGGEDIRNRNKRSLAISALRSWLFNEFISSRLMLSNFPAPIAGDAMQLAGTNSFFICENVDDEIHQRLHKKDIYVTCPLWGKGALHTRLQAAEIEKSIAQRFKREGDFLAKLGLKQERRAMLVFPENLKWELEQAALNIRFDLPAGCFATSILRELFDLIE